MARAYATFANGGNVHRRLGLRQRAARDRVAVDDASGKRREPARRRGTVRQPANARRSSTRILTAASSTRAPASAPRSPDGRSPARPARPRTTATPGSSATRRSSSPPVWVGYPNKLRPMLTEFHGDPVAGGTFPALIWKTFMEQALPFLARRAQSFPYTHIRVVVPHPSRRATAGSSSTTASAATRRRSSTSSRMQRRADAPICKPNEVDVPRRGRLHARGARSARLAAQPLTPHARLQAGAAAAAGGRRRSGSIPRAGRSPRTTRSRSSWPKALHGRRAERRRAVAAAAGPRLSPPPRAAGPLRRRRAAWCRRRGSAGSPQLGNDGRPRRWAAPLAEPAESASRSAGAAVSAGSSMVAAQAMWASGRIRRASAGRSIGLGGVDVDAMLPVPGGLAEVCAVGEVEEDGPCGVHELRDARRALVGAQGEVGCEGAGQGVVVGPGSG